MDGGTHFADWAVHRETPRRERGEAPRRIVLRVAGAILISVVATFCGDRLGDALGNREHDLADGVRSMPVLGWAFLTFPGYDLATGERFKWTRSTQVAALIAAMVASIAASFIV